MLFGMPKYKKDIKLLESDQRRATNIVEGLKGKVHEIWLKSLAFFQPREETEGRPCGGLQLPHEGEALISSFW